MNFPPGAVIGVIIGVILGPMIAIVVLTTVGRRWQAPDKSRSPEEQDDFQRMMWGMSQFVAIVGSLTFGAVGYVIGVLVGR